MRNSGPSNSSQRRGHKGRKPNSKNDRRGGNGQRSSTSKSGSNSSNRNGQQGSGSGQGQQRNASSRGKSRNQISQMWASDTSTLSSHMPNSTNTEWDPRAKKSSAKNGSVSHSRGKNKPSNGKNRSGKFERNNPRNKPHSRSSNGVSAKQASPSNRDAAPRAGKQVGNIDPFELFCAYHLGITQDKGYRTANINEVANRFRSEQGMIKQALKEYDMDPESLLNRDFDMALAQLDIQVAPEGVDRLELARGIYEEFQNAPRTKRDWKKILEEDRRENQKIFRD